MLPLLDDADQGLRPQPGSFDGRAKGGAWVEESLQVQKFLPLPSQTCQQEECQRSSVPGQEVSIPGQKVTVPKARQTVSLGIHCGISCAGGGPGHSRLFAFGDICSLIFPNVFFALLFPLHHFPPTSMFRPLELHIYVSRISRTSLIQNLMYLYAFVFLPLLPSILFSLGYDTKTVSFPSIV